ncbi:rhodanese-like domain-containing protein [Agromyces protaetiae]|uniref:rhodanese-like domain-containing protein n=1 Tax=Agromyces protaetiae TaxID=2509455 RepID=UPI001FB76CD7|nr:rhodanese-like domain-containing protein [Agromyces protaetiae]
MNSITPEAVHAVDDAYILDVREPAEVVEARVEGAAHIPLGDLVERVGEVPDDRTVYVLCRSGARSGRATEFLAAQGVDAVNIEGGIIEWYQRGLPIVSGE